MIPKVKTPNVVSCSGDGCEKLLYQKEVYYDDLGRPLCLECYDAWYEATFCEECGYKWDECTCGDYEEDDYGEE